MSRRPICTVGISAMAVLIWLTPRAASWLVYERQAILDGELWRLLTCHLVHFSESHLLLNLLAVGVTGTILETRTAASRFMVFIVVPFGIALGLLLTEADMVSYGGLSGLATAALIYVALEFFRGRQAERVLGSAVIVGLAAKIGLEWGQPPLFASLSEPFIVAAPMSHVVGAGLAAIAFGLQRWATPIRSDRDFASVRPQ